MDGLAAFALYDHIAEKEMLADTDTANPFSHDNGFIVADEFAFVIGHFVIINRQFVWENGVPIAGDPACLKFVFHKST